MVLSNAGRFGTRLFIDPTPMFLWVLQPEAFSFMPVETVQYNRCRPARLRQPARLPWR
jgi:hypothetical protein